MKRTQFTFYESFYSALSRIKKKADRAAAYDAICQYALYGTEPDIDSLPDAVAIAFELIRPNIDASAKKAAAGRNGGRNRNPESNPEANDKQAESNGQAEGKQEEAGSKQQASGKQTGSKPQADAKQTASTTEADRKQEQTGSENEDEKEGEKENEIEDECPPIPPKGGEKADAAFGSFWAAYPRKQGKGAARKAFQKARKKASLETMLSAIERQRRSAQWTRDGGQYIPQPATWLNQERWSDELDAGYQNGGGYDGNGPGAPGGGGFKPSSGFRGW